MGKLEHSLKKKRRSPNPLGRMSNATRAALSWVEHKQRKERSKRKAIIDGKKRNAQRKMARRQKLEEQSMEEWVESVQYMHDQIKLLKDACQGSVLSVYRTVDPEENEEIAYEDKDRDRLTEYQEKRLRLQCLAVRVYYVLRKASSSCCLSLGFTLAI